MPNESHSWHHSAEAELDVQLGMAETGPAATWNGCAVAISPRETLWCCSGGIA